MRATGQNSCISLAPVFLGMRIIVGVLQIIGTKAVPMSSRKILVIMLPSCSAQSFLLVPSVRWLFVGSSFTTSVVDIWNDLFLFIGTKDFAVLSCRWLKCTKTCRVHLQI